MLTAKCCRNIGRTDDQSGSCVSEIRRVIGLLSHWTTDATLAIRKKAKNFKKSNGGVYPEWISTIWYEQCDASSMAGMVQWQGGLNGREGSMAGRAQWQEGSMARRAQWQGGLNGKEGSMARKLNGRRAWHKIGGSWVQVLVMISFHCENELPLW